MEKDEKFQSFDKLSSSPSLRVEDRIDPEQSRTGQRPRKPEYINENCWLAKTLNYSPAKRCQYCKLKFRHCLFFQYLIISLILIVFLLTLSFLIEGKISKLVTISIFVLVIIYGYFFNKSTEKIIQAYFAQRKAKEALEELTESLEQRVEEQTKELRRANEELKILDEAKSEFISIASHQLRTPLTSIKGLISMALEDFWGPLNKEQKKYLGQVYQSEERLLRLIEDLLDISRMEAGRMQFVFQPLNLMEIVKEVIGDLANQAKQKNLELRLLEASTSEKSLPKVKADPLKIRQVVQNLIDNAIKYTEKGEVVVRLEKENGSVVFSVSDTGMGITKEDRVNLFEKFQRGKGVNVRDTEGTGLGLYLAAKIVEAHGGKIWAVSEGRLKGSTFSFSLPMIK